MQNHRSRAGLIAGPAALLLSAGTAQAQTQPATPPAPPAPAAAPLASQDPVPLFKSVCIEGLARLSRKWASATTYRAMPAAAKAAVGRTDAEVPNPVFQIGGGDEFLILPAPASGPVFADSCAVVWKGENLAEARTMVALAPKGVTVAATATKGWVLLKAMPTPPASR